MNNFDKSEVKEVVKKAIKSGIDDATKIILRDLEDHFELSDLFGDHTESDYKKALKKFSLFCNSESDSLYVIGYLFWAAVKLNKIEIQLHKYDDEDDETGQDKEESHIYKVEDGLTAENEICFTTPKSRFYLWARWKK